jgi:hypothetical protein
MQISAGLKLIIGSKDRVLKSVTDFCNGKTLIEDINGRVLAKDFKTKEKKLLKPGQKFWADGKR